MGDRANIEFKHEGSMYFYTHWDGYKIKEIVKNALIRGKDIWDDPPYLARIIFCELIKDDILGLYGYGLSVYIGDGQHNIITIDAENKQVYYDGTIKSFEDFIK